MSDKTEKQIAEAKIERAEMLLGEARQLQAKIDQKTERASELINEAEEVLDHE